MELVAISFFYWLAVAIVFVIGIIRLISSSAKNKSTKPGLKLMIIAVIMVVIGIGACAAIIGGIGIQH